MIRIKTASQHYECNRAIKSTILRKSLGITLALSPSAVLCRLFGNLFIDTLGSLSCESCDLMWEKTLTILLIAGSLHGQQTVTNSSKKPSPDQNSISSDPGVTVTERHDKLRQGREEDFAIVFCSRQSPCGGGCGAEPDPSQPGVVPLAFDIDPPLGLRIRYRDGRKYRTLVPGTPARIRSGGNVLLIKVKAEPDAPLGVQKLHGNLMFQTVEPGKASHTEQIAVDFQVVITGHDAKVEESDWRFGSQIGRHIKDIALAPLVPFQFLLFVIACSTSTCEI